MRRWWRSHSVTVRLTLWYVAAMVVVLAVYAAVVFAFVNRSISETLNTRLLSDFQWASAMVEQTPEGGITWYEDITDEEFWLRVWSADGELLYQNSEAARSPLPESRDISRRADESIVEVNHPVAAVRVLTRRGQIGGNPVIIQVGRTEAAMRQAGAVAYLTKGVQTEEILAAIRAAA